MLRDIASRDLEKSTLEENKSLHTIMSTFFENKPCLVSMMLRVGVKFQCQAPAVKGLDNAIHRINRYPVDKS